MKELQLKSVTITLTEACNLNCIYCFEEHKSNSMINSDIVRTIIDSEIEDISGYDGIEFELFGGEPFICFNKIKEIVEYIKDKECKFPIFVSVSTNGTLVHGDIKQWIEENKDFFKCGLSYDGTFQMQDINRSGSSKDIDLDFFRSVYPEQPIKMTISTLTLSDLAEGVIFLHKKGFDINCNLAYDIDWSNTKYKEILENQLLLLINYYLQNPQVKPCSMLDMDISSVAKFYLSPKKKMVRFCGAGVKMKAYHIDGTAYPCQYFMPLSVGKEKAQKSLSLKFYDYEIPQKLVEEKCIKCVAQSVCPTCYGSNYAATGNMYQHDENYCELTKIIIKARSYFKAMQWKKGQLSLSKDEEALLLKSIELIQENL